MNSDVSSSEHELSQDGSSQNNPSENSVSSPNSNESLNQVELSDNPEVEPQVKNDSEDTACLLYTSPSPRDQRGSRMPSSA